MKHNFNLLLAIGALVLLVESASAQSKLDKLMNETTPEERASIQTSNMKEKLSLTDQQYHPVHEINLKYARKMQNIYMADQGKLKRLKSMKVVSEEKDKEMKRVLNSSQYEMYRQQKEEMKADAKEKRNSRNGK